MKLPRRNFLHLAAGAAALPVVPRIAFGQAYPSRAVRVIVPFAPGGGTDIFARIAAQKLGESLGQQFYIENIAGAGGNIGVGQAARATPDGYTVLFAFGSFVVNPNTYAKVPYDPQKDFAPITLAVVATTEPGGAGNERQGPHRPHQSQPRKIQLRFRRGWGTAASRGRTASSVTRPRPRARALQWRRSSQRLRRRWPYPDGLRVAGLGCTVCQGRQAAVAGDHEQGALPVNARCSNDD